MSSSNIDLRMAERGPIDEVVLVRTVAARNQPQPVPRPATLVDISPTGAGLRVPADIDLRRGWLVELGVDSEWSRARIVWCHSTIGGETAAGVEFVATESAVAPTLIRWFERQAPVPT
jgi:PilZ domain